MNVVPNVFSTRPVPLRLARRLFPITAAILMLCADNLPAQSPLVVRSIADLRALNVSGVTNDTVVLVNDYYDIGSWHGRGGGFFRWESLGVLPATPAPVDDGGRFISPKTNLPHPLTGIWERMLQGEVPNVKMWGAVGNGVADDFLAISNAIKAIEADDYWAGELLFPAGIYMVTNTLVFNTDLVAIRGEHPAKSVVVMRTNYYADIFRTANADSAIKTSGAAYDYDHHLRVSDIAISFQSSDYDSSDSCLVVCQPGEANSINNIHTENGAFGIRCFNSGAPGLRLRDVTVSDASIAGVSVEPIPGQMCEGGNPVSFIGVSGDLRRDTAAPRGSLIRFFHSTGGGEISQVKAEGDFGGGVIQYTYPASVNGIGTGDHGYLEIHNCSYNAGNTYAGNFYTPAFLTLNGTNQTPDVLIHMLNLYNCPQLINDNVGNRIVDADIQNYSGISQTTARQPISYNSCAQVTAGGTNTGRLVIGQTAYSFLYPTNGTGWYRVMQYIPGHSKLSGKLVFGLIGEASTELHVDEGWNDGAAPCLTLTRCAHGNSGSPIITQARAWYDANGACFLDLYVGNPVTGTFATVTVPRLSRLTITHDLNGDENLDMLGNQLVPVPYPVSATLPPGSTSTVINTYR